MALLEGQLQSRNICRSQGANAESRRKWQQVLCVTGCCIWDSSPAAELGTFGGISHSFDHLLDTKIADVITENKFNALALAIGATEIKK